MGALRAAIFSFVRPPPLDAPVAMRPRRPLAVPLALRMHRRLGKMMRDFTRLFAYVIAHGGDAPPRRKPAPRPDAAAAQAAEAAQPAAQWAAQRAAQWAAQWAARTAPQEPPQEPPKEPPGAAVQPESPPRAPRLPGHAGWLAGLSSEISAYGGQLQHLLAGPDSLEVLRRSPALMRLLHPLCRALAVAMPAELQPLLPPKPPRAPRVPRPRKRRWHPPRRADLHFLLRMGKPIPEN
jgi:hypothetical protein